MIIFLYVIFLMVGQTLGAQCLLRLGNCPRELLLWRVGRQVPPTRSKTIHRHLWQLGINESRRARFVYVLVVSLIDGWIVVVGRHPVKPASLKGLQTTLEGLKTALNGLATSLIGMPSSLKGFHVLIHDYLSFNYKF